MRHQQLTLLLWAACLLCSAQAWAQNVYSVAFSVAQVGDKRLLHVSSVSGEADDATRESVLASYAEQLRRASPQRAALFQDAQARLFPSQEAAQRFRQSVLDNGKASGMELEKLAAAPGAAMINSAGVPATTAVAADGWPLTAAQAKQRQAEVVTATGLPLMMSAAGMEFILIPSGEFRMGSPPDEVGRGNDEDAHRVLISKPFYIARNDREVPVKTFGELDKWLNQLQSQAPAGFAFRLPTEAEWEYSARAGRDSAFHTGAELYGAQFGDSEFKGEWAYENCEGTRLNGIRVDEASPARYLFDGNNLRLPPPIFGFRGCTDNGKQLYEKQVVRRSPPPAARQFQPNAWGLYDVAGRLGEIVADRYAPYTVTSGVQRDPLSKTGEGRVMRGGRGIDAAPLLRLSRRVKVRGEVLDPDPRFVTVGIRLVLMKLD
ncbi:SUMF1/EgtB/PvdO family nonheme iron enzyme [Comamonas testosteroni]|uniref:formylglycine-generating enzyme family protein n=1 Tax=Comamonas testosteroni TaxID=285 RepID=UPI0026F200EE|nr:SUMF1/EgtB/PvdO family nonheme iron enzyme [Comamonas testosteroni]